MALGRTCDGEGPFLPMSHQMQRAFYAIPLPPTAKLIGLTLAWHHNAESGRCDPSVLLLAKETCVCERSISMALKALEADGHITIIRRTGQHNHYLLHPRSKCGTASDAPPQEMRETPAADAVPPPQQMRYTPAADAAKLEVTGRVNRKEPESFASAAANAGEPDSLFPIEPPQPKPQRERKLKPETTTDHRHREITFRIGAAFSEVMEVPFIFSTRFAKELATFLKQYPGTADDFLGMYQQMLKAGRMPYANATKKAADPCFLARNWNACVVELENIAGQYHSQPKKR